MYIDDFNRTIALDGMRRLKHGTDFFIVNRTRKVKNGLPYTWLLVEVDMLEGNVLCRRQFLHCKRLVNHCGGGILRCKSQSPTCKGLARRCRHQGMRCKAQRMRCRGKRGGEWWL
jgi:hypothetical protein